MDNDAAPDSDETVGQTEVISFLLSPEAHGLGPSAPVERHETHGALVFLAGARAFKIKRAVRYTYMDFSTLDKRRRVLERELAINRCNAPDLYIDVVAITRESDGNLRIAGAGIPVEWALRMHRFEQTSLLSHRVSAGLGTDLVKALADEVSRMHGAAPISPAGEQTARIAGIIRELTSALSADSELASASETVGARATARLRGAAELLDRRSAAGKVRRCHGDLHLDNIVVWKGMPTLFDAIEFDEDIATIDTLYDLAFLLMDLDVHGARPAANALLNRYLWRTRDPLDLDGLALLPLFLALRAFVRAMVAVQKANLTSADASARLRRSAHEHLSRALAYLTPPPATLVAVGGFSGSGKSTLAAALAPYFGQAPGAILLRSDVERKALLGVDELKRLPPAAYTRESSAKVYAEMKLRAARALAAGQAAVLDAVFSAPTERAAAEAIARDAHVPFLGLWLDAEPAELIDRVEQRTADASDASTDVVEAQLLRGAGEIDWHVVDSSGTKAQTLAKTASLLRAALPDAAISDLARARA